MLRTYGRGEGNVNTFLPDSLPRRTLRGISMLYNWHGSVAGFLLSQLLLPGLWATGWWGKAACWSSRLGIRGLPAPCPLGSENTFSLRPPQPTADPGGSGQGNRRFACLRLLYSSQPQPGTPLRGSFGCQGLVLSVAMAPVLDEAVGGRWAGKAAEGGGG